MNQVVMEMLGIVLRGITERGACPTILARDEGNKARSSNMFLLASYIRRHGVATSPMKQFLS